MRALTIVKEYHDNTGRKELHSGSVIMNTTDPNSFNEWKQNLIEREMNIYI